MGPQLINADAADRLAGALCSTLMHSLWQGILLAAVAGLIIICTRKASSALRYNLLIGALMTFAIGVGATFAWQYGSLRPMSALVVGPVPHFNGNVVQPHVPPGNLPQVRTPQVRVFAGGQEVAGQRFSERMNNFLSEHHNAIVFVWFLIVCARSLQLGFGLYGTYRLRRVRVMKVIGDWQRRLHLLADGLGIKQAVTLLESGLAKVPMVIGHLKPVILVPVGLLTALSAEEVEAILIHELAHIKRRDYLVNMLQSLMEIVFFFNPAVLWVSKLIKTERENCCDDLAVAQNNNKINYIRALVSCEEYQASVPAYAMGLTGGKNMLLNRVKRMVSNKNYSLNLFEKTILAICLVVLGLGVSAFTARENIKKAVNSIVAAIHHDAKTDKAKVGKVDTTKKKQVEANKEVNQILDKLHQLRPDTLKLNGSSPMNVTNHYIDSLIKLNGNLSGSNGGNLQLLNAQQKPDTLVLKLLNNKINQQLLLNQRPDTGILNKLRQTSAIGRELYREHLITDTNHLKIFTNLDKRELIVNGVRMPDEVYQRIYNKFYKKSGNGSYKSNDGSGRSYQNYTSRYNGYKQISEQIAWDLLKEDNLIKDKSHFSYKLSKDGLDIDGEKQPDDVFRRIAGKYFKPDDDFNLNYTYHDPNANANAYANAAANYSANASKYRGLSEEQRKYWAGQERKIIDEMEREGLIESRKSLSFTLTNKEFIINGEVQGNEVFQRYRREYAPAGADDNWNWNYFNTPGSSSANANDHSNWRSRDWDEYSRQSAAERNRIEAERDKKLVADLLQDGLITSPNNVTFTLSNKKLEINGKKQSAELYQKYKDKYVPNDSGGDWSWTYSHHE